MTSTYQAVDETRCIFAASSGGAAAAHADVGADLFVEELSEALEAHQLAIVHQPNCADPPFKKLRGCDLNDIFIGRLQAKSAKRRFWKIIGIDFGIDP